MMKQERERADDSDDRREAVEAADDTGMIAQQELLHVVDAPVDAPERERS